MPPSASDIVALLRVLSAHQVKFIVVGGLGAVLRGAPITTFDVDIVHSRSKANCSRLARALKALDARYRGHPKPVLPTAALLQSSGRHLLSTRYGPLDVLGMIGRNSGYRELLKSSPTINVEPDFSIRVLALAELIRTKEETARGKDRAVLATLRRTLAEQKRAQGRNH
jgi:hypothetical protein